MSVIRTYAVRVVGALALVALLPTAVLAQSSLNLTIPTTSSTDSAAPAPKLAVPAPKAPQAPVPFRWSGVYFGGFIGDAWSKTDVNTATTYSPTGYFAQSSVNSINNDEGPQTLKTNEIIYGGEAGYDFQVARLVFGGSFDFSVMTMNDFVVSGTTYPCCAPTTYAITQTMETNWLMTARARVGWVSGRRLLIFGTAGIAWTDLKYQAQFSDNFEAATESADFDELINGWIYGGGAEYRLTPHISVKGEYLYSVFDDVSITSTNLRSTSGDWPQNVFTHSTSFTLNVAKGSIKVRF